MNKPPIAFHFTWTTYGTWLPGDPRGWVKRHKPGIQPPDANREMAAKLAMTEPMLYLTRSQRDIVEATIRKHCTIRKWDLHAVRARTNHVHSVVGAHLGPDDMRDQLKAWCTRHLKDDQRDRQVPVRKNWWTQGGSSRWIYDLDGLEAAVWYVLEGQ